MDVSQTPQIQLEYGPPSRWHHGQPARRVMILCIVVLSAGLFMRWGYELSGRLEASYRFRECMSYVAPSELVVLDTAATSGAAIVPSQWNDFYLGWGHNSPVSKGTLFLHERTTRTGKRRLVVVDIESVSPGGVLTATYRVFDPPVSLAPARLTETGLVSVRLGERNAPLKIHIGQHDPQNPAHFTVTYEAGPHSGLVDGWLLDDETVVLEPRSASRLKGSVPPSQASSR